MGGWDGMKKAMGTHNPHMMTMKDHERWMNDRHGHEGKLVNDDFDSSTKQRGTSKPEGFDIPKLRIPG